jgi:hypothetical protein
MKNEYFKLRCFKIYIPSFQKMIKIQKLNKVFPLLFE